jgi:DNA-binding transcriptional LysR family regulator
VTGPFGLTIPLSARYRTAGVPQSKMRRTRYDIPLRAATAALVGLTDMGGKHRAIAASIMRLGRRPGGFAPLEFRIADLKPAGTLSFSGYEQIIPAAVAGHGVALGRSPLVKDLIDSKQLVAPFKSMADPARAYFVIVSRDAAQRPEVNAFVEWLKSEAATE